MVSSGETIFTAGENIRFRHSEVDGSFHGLFRCFRCGHINGPEDLKKGFHSALCSATGY